MFATMHRGNIASVRGNRIILDGTTIEEVRDYHLKTLKLVIQEANKQYKQLVIQAQLKQERELKKIQRDSVKSVINDLKF